MKTPNEQTDGAGFSQEDRQKPAQAHNWGDSENSSEAAIDEGLKEALSAPFEESTDAPGGGNGNSALTVPEPACEEATAGELTQSQKEQRYKKQNGIIARGLETFVAVGLALKEVHDLKLYEIEFKTWDEYLDKKWGYQKSYASRLMRGAELAQEITREIDQELPGGNVLPPTMEAQVRPLLRLDSKEEQLQAWRDAHAAHPDKPATPQDVADSVEKLKLASKQSPEKKSSSDANEGGNGNPFENGIKICEFQLADGSKKSFTFRKATYIDPKLAQGLLDMVHKGCPEPVTLTAKFQALLLQEAAGINALFDSAPSEETKNAVRDYTAIIGQIPILAAKPGTDADQVQEPSPNSTQI